MLTCAVIGTHHKIKSVAVKVVCYVYLRCGWDSSLSASRTNCPHRTPSTDQYHPVNST